MPAGRDVLDFFISNVFPRVWLGAKINRAGLFADAFVGLEIWTQFGIVANEIGANRQM
jgi:hypothetical protein